MSDDEVIKNPNRSTYTAPQRYVPNYVQLQVSAVDPLSGRTSFSDSSLKRESESLITHTSVSSFDGETFSDEGVVAPDDGEIIDNNDFVNLDPINYPRNQAQDESSEPASELPTKIIDIGEYLLIVGDKIVSKGSLEEIERHTTLILYGEHPMFNSTLDISDIVVLKRVGIKFGVFLDE